MGLIGKYVRVNSSALSAQSVFKVMDKITVAVASGTNAYVENQKFILMGELGKLYEFYHTEIASVLPLEEVPAEALANFQKLNYRH